MGSFDSAIIATLYALQLKYKKRYCFPSQNKLLELIRKHQGIIRSRRTLNRRLKVLEDEARIIHLLAENISSAKVTGKIEWQTRFDHMQQHSGQHILSQSFHELLGAETLSFHLGEANSSVQRD